MNSNLKPRLKILAIDDDRDLLDTLSIVLSSCGHEATCISSGAEGMSLLQTKDFDVALVDLRMPRVDGHEFLRFAMLIKPETKVIMMSAYATAEAVVEAIRENVYDYLLKPFKLVELQGMLDRVSHEILSSMHSRKE